MPTRTCVICFHEKVLFQIPPCGNVGPHREMCTECCARTIMTSGKCPLCRAPFEPEIDFYEYEMTCTAEELPEIFPSLPLDEKMQLIEYFARSGNLEMVNRNSHRMSRLLGILFFFFHEVQIVIGIDPRLAVTLNNQHSMPHLIAIQQDNIEMLNFFLDSLQTLISDRTSVQLLDLFAECSQNSLSIAIASGSTACEARLLELGVDPSKKGYPQIWERFTCL